jgi:hypothetical protein
MSEVPEGAWEKLVDWISGFGHGVAGFAVLAMVLLALVLGWRAPVLWKDWLDHRKSGAELRKKTKEIELEIVKRVESMQKRASKKGDGR